jgi:hypothetical protein
MPNSVIINGTVFKGKVSTSNYNLLTNNKYYSAVPVIDLSSYLKTNNVVAGAGISLNYFSTGVTISSTVSSPITGATAGLSVYGKNIGLSVAYSGATSTAINNRLLISNFNSYTGSTNTVLNSKLNSSLFNSFTGTTAPATYLKISNFNSYTGSTNTALNSKLNSSLFNSFTGSTLPNTILSGATTPFVFDAQSASPVYSYKTNIDNKGQGQVIMTNGSNIVSGISTNFTDATTGKGMSYWFQLWVKDSANNWYLCFLSSITNATRAVISTCYSRTQIRNGYNANTTTFPGVSGTYSYYITRNWSDGLFSTAFGSNSYADNFSLTFGSSAVATGQTAFAAGYSVFAGGQNAIVSSPENRTVLD